MSFYNKPRNSVLSCLPELPTVEEGPILPEDNVSGAGARALTSLLPLTALSLYAPLHTHNRSTLRRDINSIPEPLKKRFPEYERVPTLLYAIMDFAPLDSAREKFAKEIVDCGTSDNTENTAEERLIELGIHYFYHLISPFKTSRIKTPIASASSSLSTNTDHALIEANLTPPKRSHVKAKALQRDSYRCLVSGTLDISRFHEDIQESVDYTEAAHIIPFYLGQLDSPGDAGSASIVTRFATFWQIVSWFGDINYKDLNGRKSDSLENILTLCTVAHHHFYNLKLWFEEKSPDHYEIHYVHAAYKISASPLAEIHFTTLDNISMPIPKSSYLRLHAACAKIAHMSAMAKVMDRWDREIDEMDVLASDGSSMPLLASRLAAFSQPG